MAVILEAQLKEITDLILYLIRLLLLAAVVAESMFLAKHLEELEALAAVVAEMDSITAALELQVKEIKEVTLQDKVLPLVVVEEVVVLEQMVLTEVLRQLEMVELV